MATVLDPIAAPNQEIPCPPHQLGAAADANSTREILSVLDGECERWIDTAAQSVPAAKQVALTRLFAATIFTSAFLGFAMQPMVGRMILPSFGGATAVWTTAMLFFQATLLAGYAYAHLTTAWLGVRRSAAIHLAIMLLPLLSLPIAIPQGWHAPADGNPAPWLLGCLLASAGLPFLIVSTSAPLFQKWFAATGHARSREPYFLYAASNVGSLAGLLSYPTLIEPAFGLKQQGWFWSAGYLLLAGLAGCCAVAVWRSRSGANADAENGKARGKPLTPIGFLTRLRWLMLAFIPSSLLLGVTSYLSTDIAPVPLLWVVPLGLYLLTFIIAFGRSPSWVHRWIVWSLPLLLALPLTLTFAQSGWQKSLILALAVHLTTFAAVGLVFHGELARCKPEAARLTEFYLWVSLGGMLGGVFNALIAPLIFSTLLEYRLMLIIAGLAMPAWRTCWPWRMTRRREVLAVALVAAFAALLWLPGSDFLGSFRNVPLLRVPIILFWWQGGSIFWKFGLPLVACGLLLTRPWLFGLGIGITYFVAASAAATSGQHQYYQGRSFYGTFSVWGDEGGNCRIFVHGGTVHGAQWMKEPYRHLPTMYYDPSGPMGSLFQALREDAIFGFIDHVAITGLGAGGLATYGRHGEDFSFFEIDPAVERVARTQFTYLSDSQATCRVVLGDARLSMAKEADKKYRLIVLDAFNSDAVPTHLLTREAMTLYCDKLQEHGIIMVDISNRFLDLEPVVFAVAKANGLAVRACYDDTASPAAAARGKTASHWAILARCEDDFRTLKNDPRWRRVCRREVRPWTDDYSNIAGIFRLQGEM